MPLDQPVRALDMIDRFIGGKSFHDTPLLTEGKFAYHILEVTLIIVYILYLFPHTFVSDYTKLRFLVCLCDFVLSMLAKAIVVETTFLHEKYHVTVPDPVTNASIDLSNGQHGFAKQNWSTSAVASGQSVIGTHAIVETFLVLIAAAVLIVFFMRKQNKQCFAVLGDRNQYKPIAVQVFT